MTIQLVPEEILKKTDKILFITHLALGDFTYLQNCFKSFSEIYPHIKIHIWVDEVRRTDNSAAWPYLKKYALYDWLAECPFIAKVYAQTYSPTLFQESIQEAQQQNYSLVVSLSTLRRRMYASLAREISPNGFVVGMKERTNFFSFGQSGDRKLNANLNPDAALQPGVHISAIYAMWFEQIFGFDTTLLSRLPFVQMPDQWKHGAQQQLRQWGMLPNGDALTSQAKLIFINPYAKNEKRCWPLARVLELVTALRQNEAWRDARIIVNVVPEELAKARKFFEMQSLNQFQLFSAQDNFFQLPAMLRECDLIISVETAVMHLANAVHVPVIALMRQKTPEWAPIDQQNSTVITTRKRRDWVSAIKVEQVMNVLS